MCGGGCLAGVYGCVWVSLGLIFAVGVCYEEGRLLTRNDGSIIGGAKATILPRYPAWQKRQG